MEVPFRIKYFYQGKFLCQSMVRYEVDYGTKIIHSSTLTLVEEPF